MSEKTPKETTTKQYICEICKKEVAEFYQAWIPTNSTTYKVNYVCRICKEVGGEIVGRVLPGMEDRLKDIESEIEQEIFQCQHCKNRDFIENFKRSISNLSTESVTLRFKCIKCNKTSEVRYVKED